MHVYVNKHLDSRTCMQTDRWIGRQTDRFKHMPSRTRARKHMNACIDECTHVRSNIWMHEHAQDRQTNGRIDSHICPHACVHAHARTLACYHAHTMHSDTYAWTDRYTYTCSYGGKHPSTNMEVRSKKLEVRS